MNMQTGKQEAKLLGIDPKILELRANISRYLKAQGLNTTFSSDTVVPILPLNVTGPCKVPLPAMGLPSNYHNVPSSNIPPQPHQNVPPGRSPIPPGSASSPQRNVQPPIPSTSTFSETTLAPAPTRFKREAKTSLYFKNKKLHVKKEIYTLWNMRRTFVIKF